MPYLHLELLTFPQISNIICLSMAISLRNCIISLISPYFRDPMLLRQIRTLMSTGHYAPCESHPNYDRTDVSRELLAMCCIILS